MQFIVCLCRYYSGSPQWYLIYIRMYTPALVSVGSCVLHSVVLLQWHKGQYWRSVADLSSLDWVSDDPLWPLSATALISPCSYTCVHKHTQIIIIQHTCVYTCIVSYTNTVVCIYVCGVASSLGFLSSHTQ